MKSPYTSSRQGQKFRGKIFVPPKANSPVLAESPSDALERHGHCSLIYRCGAAYIFCLLLISKNNYAFHD
jgi:hypothetical protein